MTRILPACVAMAVATASVTAHADDPAAALEVDMSALPDDEVTRGLQERLLAHQTDTLERGGIEVSDQADNRFHVTVRRYGEGDIHYEAEVSLYTDGAATPEVTQTVRCELCRDSELVSKVGEEVARLSGRILYASKSSEENETAAVTPDPTPADDNTDDPEVRPIGAVGGIGIALGVGGLATAIAGGVYMARGVVVEGSDAGVGNENRTDYGPPGRVLLGTGLGVLAVGVVMVGVDVGIRAKKRKRSRTTWRLQPGPGLVGAAISGRF